jgi:hypothetical protein
MDNPMLHPFFNGHLPFVSRIYPRHGGGVPGVMGIGVFIASGSGISGMT